MRMRLQKFIASSGLVSRRKAEGLITAGNVFVNGVQVMKLGTTIDPEVDVVRVNGEDLQPQKALRYFAVYKPVGVVSTRAQYKNERTIYDIVPGMRDLVIAGRLDRDSEGLMLLTNDGALVQEITHPKYEHQKEYEIATSRALTTAEQEKLLHGVKLQEGIARFQKLTPMAGAVYRVVIHQGWKRQIRRMLGKLHIDVLRLTRIRISKLLLGDLSAGEVRPVSRNDIL